MIKMKKTVIYARVSSESDRQNTERQVEDLKRYIAINDMDLVKVYEEKMSGAKENRPVLTECIEFCIENHINTLCVSEISRLGRSTKIVVNTIDELTKAGVNVYIQNLPLCTLNADGQPNPIAKTMSEMKTSLKLTFKESDNTIADLITDGCNMGVKSLNRYLNQYKAADEFSKDIAKRLINLEEKLAVDIRCYL